MAAEWTASLALVMSQHRCTTSNSSHSLPLLDRRLPDELDSSATRRRLALRLRLRFRLRLVEEQRSETMAHK